MKIFHVCLSSASITIAASRRRTNDQLCMARLGRPTSSCCCHSVCLFYWIQILIGILSTLSESTRWPSTAAARRLSGSMSKHSPTILMVTIKVSARQLFYHECILIWTYVHPPRLCWSIFANKDSLAYPVIACLAILFTYFLTPLTSDSKRANEINFSKFYSEHYLTP